MSSRSGVYPREAFHRLASSQTSFGVRSSRIHFFPTDGLSYERVAQFNLEWTFSKLDSGFQSLVGFRILSAGFRIPKPRIPDSTSKKFLDSGIRIPLHGTSCDWSSSMISRSDDTDNLIGNFSFVCLLLVSAWFIGQKWQFIDNLHAFRNLQTDFSIQKCYHQLGLCEVTNHWSHPQVEGQFMDIFKIITITSRRCS